MDGIENGADFVSAQASMIDPWQVMGILGTLAATVQKYGVDSAADLFKKIDGWVLEFCTLSYGHGVAFVGPTPNPFKSGADGAFVGPTPNPFLGTT